MWKREASSNRNRGVSRSGKKIEIYGGILEKMFSAWRERNLLPTDERASAEWMRKVSYHTDFNVKFLAWVQREVKGRAPVSSSAWTPLDSPIQDHWFWIGGRIHKVKHVGINTVGLEHEHFMGDNICVRETDLRTPNFFKHYLGLRTRYRIA